MSPSAVLLMAYGTPASVDDVPAYYAHIRRGRTPAPDQVADLVARYRAIGGVSPLLTITREAAAALAARLSLPVYVGMKHWHPFIADTVAQMHRDGIARAAAVVLAPHYSRMSVGVYLATAREAAARCGGPALAAVEAWHLHPGLVAALAARVRAAQARLPAGADAHVLFTAHSLPTRVLDWGDPYPAQLVASARAVAAAAGVARWSFAFQSASATGEPWLGPDVLDALRDLHAKGTRQVVVCPIGFVADHLEVLYDLDIEAAGLARALGMAMVRTESLNASPAFVDVLADVAASALGLAQPAPRQ
jgi:ferrochelatase